MTYRNTHNIGDEYGGSPRDELVKVASFKDATRWETFIDATQAAVRWEKMHGDDSIRFIQCDYDAWVVSFDHAGFGQWFIREG